MNDLKCFIVRDLLPLYIDNTCSEETSEAVKSHLESCRECKKLYLDMTEDFASLVPKEITMDEKKLFSHAKKSIIYLIMPLVIITFCLSFNMYSILLGKSAGNINLVLSSVCILLWSFFIFHSRKLRPMLNFSITCSLFIFLSSATALAQLPPGVANIFTDILSFVSAVPFFGFTAGMTWQMTSAASCAISFIWLLYACAVKYLVSPFEPEYKKKEGGFSMNKRIILTAVFFSSFIPMLFDQYGRCKGVQEISGLINLFNPVGIFSVCVFLIGVWGEYKKKYINRILGALGTVGIIISELYKFLTWHYLTITGEISLKNSVEFAFPEFYIGLFVSIAMVAVFFIIDKKFE